MAEKPDPLGNGRDLLLAVVVGIFGLATIILGIARVTGDIGSPFEVYNPTDYQISTRQSERAQENHEKVSRDTDGDGLNDFIEEFQFGTSAYLTDTDSDGRSDKEEVDNGEDPLCPIGKTCRSFRSTGDDDSAAVAVAAEEPTADEIRDLLVEGTELTPESLKDVSDEDLMELYRETADEVDNPFDQTTTGNSEVVTGLEDIGDPYAQPLPGTDIVIRSLEDVKSLEPEQVRAFLMSLGATDEDLSGLTNEDLKAILVQLVDEQLGQVPSQQTESPEGQ